MASNPRSHFLDRISTAHRQKLSAHRMLRPEGIKHTLLERKLRPPPELRAKLLPLQGLCTYKLLENLRYGDANPVEWDTDTVSESIGAWFTQLRDTTSEWATRSQDRDNARRDGMTRQGLLSNQWECMGEELQALDKVTRVPRDAPEIQKIYRAARAVPEYIIKKLNKDNGRDILKNLTLIGSFACDNKVMDLDEFDFLVCAKGEYHGRGDDIFSCSKLSIDEKDFSPDILDAEPSIVGFHTHGPASCTTLAWRCEEGHVHDMGVDLTIGGDDTDSTYKEVWKNMKNTVFAPVYDAIPDDEHCVLVGNVTTALIDERMFTFLVDISPNIPAAYRLMKLIISNLLPKNITYDPGVYQQTEIASIVSSHKLKLILYDCFMSHSHRDDWDAEHLHERIAEMLQTTAECRKVANPFTSGDTSTERLDQSQKSAGIGDLRMKKYLEDFTHLLIQMKDIVLAPYDRSRHEIQDCLHQFPRRVGLLLYARGKWHPHDSRKVTCAVMGSVIYICYKINSSDMLFSSHPLLQWCKATIHRQYIGSPGPDLSSLVFIHPIVWMLYTDGALSEDVFSSDEMMEQMYTLIEYYGGKLATAYLMISSLALGRARHDTVEVYTSGFPDNHPDPFIELTQCIPTLPPHERALVRQWCRHLSQCPQEEDKLVNSHLCECSRVSERVQRLARALEYIYVILHRAADGRAVMCYRAYALVYSVMYHMIQTDPAYMDPVTDKHLQWADDIIDHVTSYTQTDQIRVRNTEGEKTWRVVRVERDYNTFLRSVGANFNKGLRETERSYSGMILSHRSNNVEKLIFSKHVELLKVIWRFVPTKYIHIQNYEPLLMVAIARHYKRQVHVYEYMTGQEGVAVHTRTIPRGWLEGGIPISVLLTPGRGYSLLLPPGSEHWDNIHGEDYEGSLDKEEGVNIFGDAE